MTLHEPLDPVEARIFGALVEKSLTTPESYPLSMNSLVAACNQKSNRHPVTDYDERSVNEALMRLRLHRLVLEVRGGGSRVVKYDHDGRARIEVDEASLAILAELLLRGPQQPGELRGRASRMSAIPSLHDLEALLADMAGRNLVERLPPEPGSRAPRWRQLIAPRLHGGAPAGSPPTAAPATSAPAGPVSSVSIQSPTSATQPTTPAAPPAMAGGDGASLSQLLERMEELEQRIEALEQQLDDA